MVQQQPVVLWIALSTKGVSQHQSCLKFSAAELQQTRALTAPMQQARKWLQCSRCMAEAMYSISRCRHLRQHQSLAGSCHIHYPLLQPSVGAHAAGCCTCQEYTYASCNAGLQLGPFKHNTDSIGPAAMPQVVKSAI